MFAEFIISDIAKKEIGVICWKKWQVQPLWKLVVKKRKLKTKRDVVLTGTIHCCNTKGAFKVTLITDTSFRKTKEACNIRKKHGSYIET